MFFFFSSRRRHTRLQGDWSSDVCSSDLEGSFAQAANQHGFKRSRWRRLWRQQIQDWLIATVQNIKILLKTSLRRASGAAANPVLKALNPMIQRVDCLFPLPEGQGIIMWPFAFLRHLIGISPVCS